MFFDFASQEKVGALFLHLMFCIPIEKTHFQSNFRSRILMMIFIGLSLFMSMLFFIEQKILFPQGQK